MEKIKAMIFAAGLGTRLRPLTDTRPKALVTVGGKTLLEIQLMKLSALNVGEIIVNVHHFSQQIKDYIASYPIKDVPIRISDESSELLDTGGGLKYAFDGHDDVPVLVHNVDILSNADLGTFISRATSCDAALLVSKRPTSRYILFGKSMKMVGWTNINTGEIRSPYPNLDVADCMCLAFSGIHVVAPTVFTLMEGWPKKFSIMDFYIQNCDKLHIKGVTQTGLRLLDIGKIDALQHAEDFLLSLKQQDGREYD
jgi:NDP-sugar pyrophosphorylase family protein